MFARKMATTITIDPKLDEQVRAAAKKLGCSYSLIMQEAVRAGLSKAIAKLKNTN